MPKFVRYSAHEEPGARSAVGLRGVMQRVLETPGGRFGDCVLRGIGQVMFQDNALTGLLFLAGLFVSDWVFALYALLGTVAATLTALVFGAPRDDIDHGLYGLNGTLTGLALALYLPGYFSSSVSLSLYVIVAAIISTILTAAIRALGPRSNALTGPFVITTWLFIASIFVYGHMSGAGPMAAAAPAAPAVAALSVSDAGIGLLNGVAQVMFQENMWTGAIFLVAIAVNSRVSAVAAIVGSALGIAVAWALGAAPGAIHAGLYGFNAVLTAIALGGLLFRLSPVTLLFAILAAGVATVFYGSFVTLLGPLGLPVLTAPFVLTTWICLLAAGSLGRLRAE